MALDILATTSHVLSALEPLQEPSDMQWKDSQASFYVCPEKGCYREFTSKRNLVDHQRGHHQGSKPHTCTVPGCGKSFLRPAHLVIHNRIHTGEKPFVCSFEGCNKRWNQKSALKQHMRSHTGEKPFVCSFAGCGKQFSTSSSCKRHLLTHGPPGSPSSPKRRCLSDSWEDGISFPKKYAFAGEGGKPVFPSELNGMKMSLAFVLN